MIMVELAHANTCVTSLCVSVTVCDNSTVWCYCMLSALLHEIPSVLGKRGVCVTHDTHCNSVCTH